MEMQTELLLRLPDGVFMYLLTGLPWWLLMRSTYIVLSLVFPDDFNRVVLKELPGVEHSDYINASYVDVMHDQPHL
jgi:hypothetical protein